MKIFGLDITRATKAVPQGLRSPDRASAWWPIISEPFTGAWQRNREVRKETVLTFNAVYGCVTLIASDVSKMRLCLVEEDQNLIWTEANDGNFSKLLRKPNHYQNHIKFIENWVVSKLLNGNTYVLKERDPSGAVVALYILDPNRVKVLVADDGEVYYELSSDNLSGQAQDRVVPSREIIHDRMTPLYHPLIGVSPLMACSLAASQGLNIQINSERFFANSSRPGGVLTAPGNISDETAARLKAHWEDNFSGANAGRVAVLGDGLAYSSMSVNAVDAQLIEQLKWSAETVCSVFHVPPYMLGIGNMPTYNNIEALNQQYYSQCLQAIIESIELCLDDGLELDQVKGRTFGVEFDLDGLLRMDTATMIEAETKAVGGGVKMPNEARRRLNLKPVEGGDTPYLQQQNFSLAALAKRDARVDPFQTSGGSTPSTPPSASGKATDDLYGTMVLPMLGQLRTLERRFDEIEEAGLRDAGVWREGEDSRRGDAVSSGGSMWIAQRSGRLARPGTDKGGDWRLSVKKGRDGKDASSAYEIACKGGFRGTELDFVRALGRLQT